jgi:uncharacterized membrane protein HdeD (DUF308 family)
MNNKTTEVSNRWSNVLMSALLTLIIGGVLIFVPEAIYSTIIIIVGIIIILLGVGFFIFTNRSNALSAKAKTLWYIQSIINIIVGLFMAFQSEIVYSFIIYFLAIWLIITGASQIFFAPSQKQIIRKINIVLINGIMALALGATILIWPEFPMVFIGYITLIIGTILLYDSIIFFKHRKQNTVINYDEAEDFEEVEMIDNNDNENDSYNNDDDSGSDDD